MKKNPKVNFRKYKKVSEVNYGSKYKIDKFYGIQIGKFNLIQNFLIMRKLNEVLRKIVRDWSSSEIPEEWKTYAQYANIFCIGNILTYVTASLFYYPDVINSYVNQPAELGKTPLKAVYPFNYLSSPAYEIIFITQAVQGNMLAAVDSVSQTLLVTLVIKSFIIYNYSLSYYSHYQHYSFF